MDELLEKVDHLLNQNSSRAEIQHDKEADQKLRERLVNVNGALAADRIVDYWEAIGSENQLKNTPLEKASTGNNTTNSRNVAQNPSLIRKIRSIASNVKQLLTEFGKDTANDIPIRDDGQLLDNSFKFNSYSDSEFEHILTNLQQTLDRFQDIEYKRISNRAILISGKKQSRKT